MDEESGSPESGDEDDEDVESDSVSPQASDDDDEDEDLEKLKYDLKSINWSTTRISMKREDEEGGGRGGNARTDINYSTNFAEEDTEKQQPEPLEVSYYDINEYEDDRGSNNSRIYKNWRELANKKPPVGLLNHGVTCYMNSAIQSIIHIPAMQHYLNDE